MRGKGFEPSRKLCLYKIRLEPTKGQDILQTLVCMSFKAWS